MQKRAQHPKGKLTLEAILENKTVKKKFEDLCEAGVDRNALANLLCLIPCAPTTKLPLVEGMQDRTVLRLPDQMQRWAKKLASLNSSPFLSPQRIPEIASAVRNDDIFPEPLNAVFSLEGSRLFAQKFQSLPGLLNLYADYLRAWVPLLRKPNPRGISPRTVLTLRLLKLVRDSAKKRPLRGSSRTSHSGLRARETTR